MELNIVMGIGILTIFDSVYEKGDNMGSRQWKKMIDKKP
jgi:hypothetical protein